MSRNSLIGHEQNIKCEIEIFFLSSKYFLLPAFFVQWNDRHAHHNLKPFDDGQERINIAPELFIHVLAIKFGPTKCF
jgi:hypothetical protein